MFSRLNSVASLKDRCPKKRKLGLIETTAAAESTKLGQFVRIFAKRMRWFPRFSKRHFHDFPERSKCDKLCLITENSFNLALDFDTIPTRSTNFHPYPKCTKTGFYNQIFTFLERALDCHVKLGLFMSWQIGWSSPILPKMSPYLA